MTLGLLRGVGFEGADGALVRAVAAGRLSLPAWPTLPETGPEAVTGWLDWLRDVWAIETASDAIAHASPALADSIRCVLAAGILHERDVRRVVVSVVRYVARMTGRPTSSGLFAGVAAARFAPDPVQGWRVADQVVARADAGWLAQVISQLEQQLDILEQLMVVANSTLTVRGERLVVPYQLNAKTKGASAVEVTLRHTGPVRAALYAAREPMWFDDVRANVLTEFPHASAVDVTGLLATLVERRALITSLHAPSIEPDALGHLLRDLGTVGDAAAQ